MEGNNISRLGGKWNPVRIPQHKVETPNYEVRRSADVLPGSTQYVFSPVIGYYATSSEPIDPYNLPHFKFCFYIKVDSSQGTNYSVTVTFKDFNGEYITHSNPSHLDSWHWDALISSLTPGNSFVRKVFEYGPQKGPFPITARFIEFGILVNHNRGNKVYRCGDYEIVRSW